MSMVEVSVQAVPFDDTGGYALECSICGPVGVCDSDEVSTVSTEHLLEHGATMVGENEKTEEGEDFSD